MLFRAFEKFGKHYGTDLSKGKLLLAVSGGVDSMVLMDLAHKAKLTCGVAHVNFGLRDEDSNGDEAMVASQCKKYGFPLHIHRPQTRQFAADNHLSIQMAARDLRYRFFKDCCQEHGYQFVATAHHSGDNLENFFIYLLRNNPIAALKGIAAMRGHFVRPLLPFSKGEIMDYAEENHIPWREDVSNESDHYLRNKIRHHIIPGLKAHYPEAEQDFLDLSEGITAYLKQTETRQAELLAEHAQQTEGRTVIFRALLESGSGYRAFEDYLRSLGFNRSQIREVTEARNGAGFLSQSHYLAVESRGFVVGEGSRETAVYRYSIEELHEPLYLNAGKFSIAMEWAAEMDSPGGNDTWYFDKNAIEFPLLLRNWSQGDKMQPWGMTGHKKISDLFTDTKTGMTEKPLYPVLESGGLILGVIGLRRSAAGQVGGAGGPVLKVTWRKR